MRRRASFAEYAIPLHVAAQLSVEKKAEILVRVDFFESCISESDYRLKVIALLWRKIHNALVPVESHQVVIRPALLGIENVPG
jgi:hypothetical protein